MSAGVVEHGGLPCSRVSAGPWAAPETDVDAVNEYEHAEDENFVDMFSEDNSRSGVDKYSEDLQLFASPSPQRRRPQAESHSWHALEGAWVERSICRDSS